MFDNFESWTIKPNYDFKQIMNEIKLHEFNNKYVLNIENQCFNLIEKFVFEISNFHITKINLNKSDICIEYFIENLTTTNMDIDYIKNKNTFADYKENYYPIITTITYLNDNDIPDVLTNIDIESYMFKNINENVEFGLSFPKKLKHISFNGDKYYHGINNILNKNDKRITLKINIWKSDANNVNLHLNLNLNNVKSNFVFSKNDNIIETFEKSNVHNDIYLENNLLNEDFVENLLYRNSIYLDTKTLEKILQNKDDFDLILIKQEPTKKENKRRTLIDINCNKFLQRFTFKHFYEKFICSFIINNCVNLFDNDSKIMNYNNCKTLDIEVVPQIMNIVISSFELIIEKIKKIYCFKDINSYCIEKIFIIKNNEQVLNNFSKNNSSICINILLNSVFQGGNLEFEDGLETELEIGEMIIFNGNVSHRLLPVKNGSQYILVGLLNIYEEILI